MISHLESHKFGSIISHFNNASIVNSKGELLFSKDADPFKTTTSRLVLFQIAKKYLSPSTGDIIISNDPENGGTSLSRIYFISCLSLNLFLIWDAEFYPIDFKIPLSPFVENGKISPFMKTALIESQPNKEHYSAFFETEIGKFNTVNKFKEFIREASGEDFQKQWFMVCKNIFINHFEAKAFGQSELSYKYKTDHLLKLRTEVDEKQNQRFFKVDFSGSSLAKPGPAQISCASHVIESGLIIEFSKYYALEKYLSQPILDHVKLILPPKSIVSNAHKAGEFNFELQKMARQMMKFNLTQINAQTKKNDKKFSLYSTHLLQMTSGTETNLFFLSNSRIQFENLNSFHQKILQNTDGEYKACLVYNSDKPLTIRVSGISSDEDHAKRWLKINKAPVRHGTFNLKKGDEFILNWKI
ncbi:MAG: hypothetical protein H7Z71_04885 [Moraxellaceae bacterium]|nr:hypothetical protein [Pseudobdellovibrionaceae bacterium]